MNNTTKLESILNEIEKVSNYYKEESHKRFVENRREVPYITELNTPQSADIGDFWYCLDRQELFICNGVVNGTPKWSSIYVD